MKQKTLLNQNTTRIFMIIAIMLFVILSILAISGNHTKIFAAEGTAYAVLEDDGDLIFFRSNNTYTAGAGKTVTDINGNTYTGTLYDNFETMGYKEWRDNATAIRTVRVADGQTISPKNMDSWFRNCSNLTSFNPDGFDCSRCTDMSSMFYDCSSLQSLDLSGWDTSSVTYIDSMFRGCSGLQSMDLSGWDLSAVTYLNSMFYECPSLQSLDLSGWDISAITDMSYMFYRCSSLQSLDLSGWDTSSVTNMFAMFNGCSSLQSLDLSGWDTSSVTNMYGMFNGCSGLQSLDLSGWDTSSVTSMGSMFNGCSGLQSLDLSGWDTSAVNWMSSMFRRCSGLQSLDLSGWDTSAVTYMGYMFYKCSGLQSLDWSGWDTSAVTNMAYMFYECSGLQSLDLSGWDTSSVTEMEGMFDECSGLQSIELGTDFSFTGNNITDTAQQGLLPTPSNGAKWVNGAYGPFSAEELRDNYNASMAGTWVWNDNTYAVLTDAGELIFFRSNNAYTAGEGQTVTDIAGNSYSGKIYTNFVNVQANPWIGDATAIKTVRVANGQTISPISMTSWFNGCTNLISFNADGFDTSAVTNMVKMFYECSSLQSLDLSGWDTSTVTDMYGMFYKCSGLQSLDLSGWDTSAVTNMYAMFAYCSSLQSLGLSGWDTSAVTNMQSMFNGCSSLQSLDVSTFNTSQVTSLESMFRDCTSLTSLDLSTFDTSQATNLQSMFRNCTSLTSLDLSTFNTSSVIHMSSIFNGCTNLTSLNLSGWNTSNAVNIGHMFYDCASLQTLDLSSFNTVNVEFMDNAFNGCTSLQSLDISGFDTSSVNTEPSTLHPEESRTMNDMFTDCQNLSSIILGPNFSFKGNGLTDTSLYALLPTPSGSNLSGKWIKGDRTGDAYSPTELRDEYDGTMAGEWVWEHEYTLTLDDQSGTGGDGTVTVTDSVTLPSVTIPTRTGYDFNGYYTEQNGAGTQYIDASGEFVIEKTDITEDKTIYAYWTPCVYEITLNNQNATTAGTTAYYEKYGDGFYSSSECTTAMSSIDVPERTGYTFKGYFSGPDGTGTQYISESGAITATNTTFTEDTTLHAYWEPNVYTITLESEGTTSQSDWVLINDVPTGADIIEQKNVYKYKQGNALGNITMDGYREITDQTLAETDFATNYPDSEYDNITNSVTYDEWKDAGWKSWDYPVGATRTDVEPGTEYKCAEVRQNPSTYFHYVNLYEDGHTSYTQTEQTEADATHGNLVNSQRETTNRVGSDEQYTDGGVTWFLDTLGEKQTRWEYRNTYYSFVFHNVVQWTALDSWMDEVTDPMMQSYDSAVMAKYNSAGSGAYYEKYATGNYADASCTTAITELTPPSRNGYDFDGYYTEENGAGTKYVDSDGTILSTDTTFTENTTLYSNWIAQTYTVTYETNDDDSNVFTKTATYDADMPSITVPVKNGFTFHGYYDAENGQGTQYYDETAAGTKTWDKTEDTTLYAYWTGNEYTVTFDKQGGTDGTDSVTVAYDADMPFIDQPKLDGYTFKGYFDEADGAGTKYYDENAASAHVWDKTEDDTLYAFWEKTLYTITLDNNGGTGGTESVELYWNDPMPEITLPAKEGFTFGGYYLLDEGSEVYYYDSEGHSARNWDNTNTTVLTAKWNPVDYTVTLDQQEGTGGTASVTAHVDEPMPTTGLVLPTRSGYEFKGYYSEPDGAGDQYYDEDGLSVKNWDKAENSTLYAYWEAIPNVVTLDPQNGTDAADFTTVNVLFNQDMPTNGVTMPSWDGYKFEGYFAEPNGQGTKYYNADGTSAHVWDQPADATIYGHWSIATFTITLDQQEGTGGTESVQAQYNGTMPTATMPTRTGFAFDGYYTEPSGQGTKYYNADGTPAHVADFIADATLFANWIGDSYTVTFDKREGFGGTDSISVMYESDMEPITIPTRDGFAFVGYFEEPDGAGQQYYDGSGNPLIQWDKDSDGTLYAHWSADGYEVTLDPQEGTGGTPSVIAVYGAEMPAATMPEKTGYEFAGYFTDYNGEGTQYYNADGSSAHNWDIRTATTLYANWTAETYTITFDRQGGQGGTDSTTSQYLQALQEITPPERTGYTFNGYWTEPESEGTQYYRADGSGDRVWGIPEDTTLYAGWINNGYELVLDRQGGETGDESVTAYYELPMTEAVMPTRTGYDFAGYFTEPNGAGTQYYNADGTSSRNWDLPNGTTLYAYWIPHEYTVTFDQQGGTGGAPDARVSYGSDMPTVAMPIKETFTFNGYFTEPDGQGTQYYNADGSSTRPWDKEEDTILYAYWTETVYTITLNQEGGTGGDTQVTSAYDEVMPTAVMPVRPGYTFHGYYESPNGAGMQYYTETGASAANWNRRENATIYAYWTPNSYQVTFDKNTGHGGTDSTVAEYDANMPAIEIPEKTGYLFTGYYDATEGGKRYYDSEGGSVATWDKTDNTTLFARWKIDLNEITDPGDPVAEGTNQDFEFIKPDRQNHISVLKLDDLTQEPIEGIKFMLENTQSDADYHEIQYTDEDGIATWVNIPDGNYDVLEEDTTGGYVRKKTSVNFTVNNGRIIRNSDGKDVTSSVISVEITNLRNSLHLVKKDAETFELLQNTVFNIDGVEYTTNANGVIDIYATLEDGTHSIKEVTPSTYVVDGTTYEYVVDTRTYYFNIDSHGVVTFPAPAEPDPTYVSPFSYDENEHVITCELFNERQVPPGRIKVTKIDQTTEEVLPDAEFTLYKAYDDGLGHVEYREHDVKRTNENGELVFENVFPGEYEIKETDAPDGYYLKDPVFHQFVTMSYDDCLRTNADPEDDNYLEYSYRFTVKNVQNRYDIRKVDGRDMTPLPNATFEIWKDGAEENEPIARDVFGNNIVNHQELRTDDYGLISLYRLQDGTFHYKETKAPPNFVLHTDENGDTITFDFTVEEGRINDGEHEGYETQSKEHLNMTGYNISVYISKIDPLGEEEIDNAVFEIYPWDETWYDEENDTYGHYNTEVPISIIEYSEETRSPDSNEKEYHYYTQNPLEYHVNNKGKFLIRETATNSGYFAEWEKTFAIDTTITKTDQEVIYDDDTEVLNNRNELHVIKRDSNTQEPLAGATFRLEQFIRDEDRILYEDEDVYLEEKTTGDNGEVVFMHLKAGNYMLTEIQGPEHYITQDDKPVYFIVDQNGHIVQGFPTSDPELPELQAPDETQALGVLTYYFDDEYTAFHIHKTGLEKIQIEGEGGEIEEGEEMKPLAGVKYQFKVGTKKTDGTLRYYDDGTFIGYLVKGTKESVVDEGTDVDEFGTKVYQNDILITDENGDIELRMLIDGDWEYTETETLEGYTLPEIDGEPIHKSFKVDNYISDDAHTDTVRIDTHEINTDTNDLGFIKVNIEKIDGDTEEHLDGVQFDIYEYNAATKQYEEYITTMIADEEKGNGFYTTDPETPIAITYANQGRFRVKEVATTTGHIADWYADLIISNGNEGVEDQATMFRDGKEIHDEGDGVFEYDEETKTTTVSFSEPITNHRNRLVVKKAEAMSLRPLPNAVLKVWTSEDTDEVIGYDDEGNEIPNNYVFTTDTSGKLILNNLIADRTYFVQEQKAPTGFGLNSNIKKVVVDSDGYLWDDDNTPIEYEFDADSVGEFTLIVYNPEDGEPVPNSEVEIWKEGAEEGEVIGYYTTLEYVDDDENFEPIYQQVQKELYNHKRVRSDEYGNLILSGLTPNGNYKYMEWNDVEKTGNCEIDILNSMLLATGGDGRTMILIIGGSMLLACVGGLVFVKRRKTTGKTKK